MNYIIQRKKEFRNPRWATMFSCVTKAPQSKFQEFSALLELLQKQDPEQEVLLLTKMRKT